MNFKRRKYISISLLMFCCIFIYTPSIVNAQSLNLLPDIPEPSTNPHLATAFNGVKTGDTTFTKSFAEAEEVVTATMAYLHPSSPYKNQQAYLDRALFLLDKVLGGWNDGSMPLNEMTFCFGAPVSYLMLKQYMPSAITPQQQANWEAGLQKNIAAILSARPNGYSIYNDNVVGSLWLNGDIRLAECVYFGGIALNDSVAVAKAKNVIEVLMPQTLLNDGGTHYVGYQNESPSYHGEATIRYFAWYYILTQSQVIKDFISDTIKYIPLVRVPLGEGYHEWSTSPAWKPYYNRVGLKIEALAKAYLTGDQYNFTIGQGGQHLFLTFLYRSGLSGTTLPGNYMLYDKNSMGPRGIYGNWGVVGTLRDPSSPLPELTEVQNPIMDGVNTIVGAFTLNAAATATQYPLNAAFQGAAPQVKYASGAEDDWSRGNKWAFLTGKNRNDAQTRSKAVYGLSTNYGVSKTRFNENGIGWKSQQQWVVTPDRVIGMTEIESSVSSTMFGLAQRIQLVSGRTNDTGGSVSGTKKTLIAIDANTYEYGDLRIKIIDKNYAGSIETKYHGVMDSPVDDRSVMLNLHDINSGTDVAYTYPAGTRRYAFFEVTNNARSYSTNAARLTLVAGLEGFEFTESSGRKIRMIHNTTGSAIALNTSTMPCPYGSLRMLRSWDETLNPLTVSGGNGTIPYTTIPKYGHIVVINSNIADDHIAGINQSEDLFNSSLSFPSNLKVDSAVGTTVNLSWRAVTGATSYVVKRASVAGGTYVDVATIANTQYADTGLVNNATYYYVVVAKKSSITSAASEEVVATTSLTTTWNGTAWSNGAPNETLEAIIAGNYTTAASPGNGIFTAKKLTVNSGTVTVVTGTNLTILNEVNTAGANSIVIENNANLIQTNNVANSGPITVKRNSNPLKKLDYTMWSSPVANQNLLAFSPKTITTRFYKYNESTDQYNSVDPSLTSFATGKGYLIRMPDTDPTVGYDAGTATLIYPGVFTGVPNNGNVTLNSLVADKYYAIGNPYPSTISANAFLSGNSTGGTLYFWRKTNGTANSASAYATWTTLGGTAASNVAPNNIVPNGTLQVGQGFIVKTGLSATSLSFNNTMRTDNNNNQFLKTKNEAQKDRLWLNLTNTTGVFSQALIGYMEGATLGVDNGIDGKYINDSPIALTSDINGEEYTIQGRPAFDVSDVVPLRFKTDVAGDYSIALDHFDGVFETGQDVYLVDGKTGTETNLKSGAYSFTATVGAENRFSLKYQKTLQVDASAFNENSIMVYATNGTLYVKSKSVAINNIKVYDLQGRLLAEQKNLKTTTAVISNWKAMHQVLIVKITGEDNSLVTKKVVN